MTMTANAPRRILAALATALGLAASMTLGAAPSPASAATELLVSTDGVTFGPAFTHGLFDDIGAMVPEDTATASFWVMNPTVDPASIRVSVQEMVVSSPVLATSMMLSTWDEGTGLTNTTQLNSLAVCDIVVPGQIMAAGAVIRVDMTITMLSVTGHMAQGQLGALNFLAAMRDAAAGPFPPSACDDDGVTIPANLPAQIAHTGTDLPTDWLAAAGALVGFGILLVLARRRRHRDDEVQAE
jgi:LPXTG-motif cell wall-anchored protein